MLTIQPIGELYRADAEGYLINEADPSKIVSPWLELVTTLGQRCCEVAGDSLHSLYLRGSVPRGKAIAGISDLDSILVWQHREPDRQRLRQLEAELARQYPFCDGVELVPTALEEIQRAGLSLRALLKIQGLCIAGQDLIPGWPAVRPGPRLWLHSPHIGADLDTAVARLKRCNPGDRDYNDHISGVCGWIARRLVRTGFELVMEQEQTYTRDLYPCYESFARHYPEQAGLMYKALELAIAPSCHRAGLLLFLGQIGPFLTQEAAKLTQETP